MVNQIKGSVHIYIAIYFIFIYFIHQGMLKNHPHPKWCLYEERRIAGITLNQLLNHNSTHPKCSRHLYHVYNENVQNRMSHEISLEYHKTRYTLILV